MSRRLTPTTIIPPALYVERSADRQLRDVIQSMGRPGYILVARQMGKTNLLLNTRRTLETPDLLFVYADLSARLDSLDHYYGSLLNTAFSVHPELFPGQTHADLSKTVYTTLEFEVTLRAILRHYPGRIVFVLDEIDSLGNYAFSDRIFSQIRSMYFSRTNYPAYSRLTYILSGVAEPTDLIKDKNVSPFNIGEKIYLNDFTEAEFNLFISQAGLIFSEAVKDRVMHWAGGNPRITWDICSELELLGPGANLKDIDNIVTQLYLTTFDRAPVDHIRTLAQSDREIRQAVRDLRAGKASNISDKARNKLYLAGITGMQSAGKETIALRIKNKVIDDALSERWLSDVEKQSRGLLQLARENYEESRFEPAVAFFEEYLADHEIDRAAVDAYRLAICYFNTRRYEKSIEWLLAYVNSGPESDEVKATVWSMLGRAHLVLGNFDEAATSLRFVLSSNVKSLHGMATGLLASSLLQMDGDHSAEVIRLSEDALSLAESSAGTDEQRATVKIISLLNLSSVKEQQGEKLEAIGLLDRAIDEHSPSYRSVIILRLLALESKSERRDALLDQLAPSVINVGSASPENRIDNPLTQLALPALMRLRINDRHEDFEKLLSFLEQSGELKPGEQPETFLKLYSLAQKSSVTNARIFLHDIINRFGKRVSAQKQVLAAVRELIFSDKEYDLAPIYISMFLNQDSSTQIESDDYFVTGYIISHELRTKNIRALTALDPIVTRLKQMSSTPTIGYTFVSYLDMLRQESLGRFDLVISTAREILEVFSDEKNASNFTAENRATMESNARSMIRRHEPKTRVENPFKSIGRNTIVKVEYSDGRTIQMKFKHVQRDLVLGNCKLLEAEKAE